MPYGKRVSNRKSAELHMGTEKTPLITAVLGHSRDTAMDVDRVLSEENARLRSLYFFIFFSSGHWCGSFFVLAPLSVSLA